MPLAWQEPASDLFHSRHDFLYDYHASFIFNSWDFSLRPSTKLLSSCKTTLIHIITHENNSLAHTKITVQIQIILNIT